MMTLVITMTMFRMMYQQCKNTHQQMFTTITKTAHKIIFGSKKKNKKLNKKGQNYTKHTFSLNFF